MPDSPTREQLIIDALVKRGADKPCPRCVDGKFSIVHGLFVSVIQDDIHSLQLQGSVIPTAVLICERCGFIVQHALGTLDLLPKKDKPK